MSHEVRVRTIVAHALRVLPSRVTPESTIESLGGDSLDHVELVMLLEEEFDRNISDETADHLVTVRDYADAFA